jgi:D-alanine transaminase
MPELACVNGLIGRIEAATVSIDDRGLLFGDSVYEVFHAYDGRLWAAEAHYDRLINSLDAVGIVAPLARIQAWVTATVRQCDLPEVLVYLQITRGVAPRAHVPEADLQPTVIITTRALKLLKHSLRESGVRAITVEESRWARRDVKSTNLLANILARRQAALVDAFEALFVETDGRVNEGSSTNVFLVQQGRLRTPGKGAQILPGVTRERVINLARGLGYVVDEADVQLGALMAADEVFITGSTTEVLGVVQIDNAIIGSGRVGPVTRELWEAYEAEVAAFRAG